MIKIITNLYTDNNTFDEAMVTFAIQTPLSWKSIQTSRAKDLVHIGFISASSLFFLQLASISS
jgi:hypothetical protein